MKLMNYETLNQVQGDKVVIMTQSPGGEGIRFFAMLYALCPLLFIFFPRIVSSPDHKGR
jgi:hypothetical protein